MLQLLHPTTKALVQIRKGDLHASKLFYELVADGYIPVGEREARLSLMIVEAEIDRVERRRHVR